MKNDDLTRSLLEKIITIELKELSVHLDGIEISKFLYMFQTGVELTTRSGVVSKPPPVGPFLGYMTTVFQGRFAPESGHDPFEKIRFTGEHLENLVREAQTNDVAWIAAKELAGWFLNNEKYVPELLHPILMGEKPKRKQGRQPLENLHRDACIVLLLSGIEKEGFKPVTRNSDPIYENNYSLCDIMVKALKSIQINISYDGIKSIWKRRNDFNNLPAFKIAIETDKKGKCCYIAYADKKSFNINLPIESQAVWTISRIDLSPSYLHFLVFKKGAIIDVGKGKSFFLQSEKQFFTKKGRAKFKANIHSASINYFQKNAFS